MVEMEVAAIALDAANRVPIVILRDLSERRALPIWVGKAEANAIMQALDGQTPARPMTHDLILSSWTELGYAVDKIVVCELKDDTFYATITLRKDEESVHIDSRPSDAIAIALRADAPIWTMEEVIAEASIPVDQDADDAEREAFRRFLQGVSPKDFIGTRPSDSTDAEAN
ncbi:bifunctional nuclease family protein [Synechococcus sp. PCC 7336]|uniref:bifunctional nuclease family protein n=1 Tax=Synechococcus sp. PCC 7336 TaxID=195250 RepID=UPI00034B3B5A|nr:bifunctional nuclease family protein [Synechococcus sp. PCC 7336]